MSPKRRRFKRPQGERRYRKLFVIAVEGDKTEPQYFAMFNSKESVMLVKCLKSHHNSSPSHVLSRMEDYLKKEGLKPSDEAWLVVDKDQWTNDQLNQLFTWSKTRENYGFALSNPKFEYWILLHFEDGKGIKTSQDCSNRLKRHLPNYDKGIDTRKISRENL